MDNASSPVSDNIDAQAMPASAIRRTSLRIESENVFGSDSLGDSAKGIRETRGIAQEEKLSAGTAHQFGEIQGVGRHA